MELTIAAYDGEGNYAVQPDVDAGNILDAVQKVLAIYGIRVETAPGSIVFRKDPEESEDARRKEALEEVLDSSRWLHVEVSRLWSEVAPQSEDLDQLFRDFDEDVKEALE